MIRTVPRVQPAPGALEPLRWLSSAASAVGNREENQDAYWCSEPALLGDEAVFVVADGMGGGQFGAWAAQNAVHAVVNALRTTLLATDTRSLPDRLREAIARANAEVHALQENARAAQGEAQVGCALAVAVLRHRTLTVAHVGDVRVYLWHQGALTALTKDHSWAVELGDTSDASEGMRHVLSRAIGPSPEVEPDVYACSVEPGDVIVLCSDGVWSALPEEQMARLIARTSPRALAGRLVQAALERDASDNATALVVALARDRRPVPTGWFVLGALAVALALVALVGGWAGLFVGARAPIGAEGAPAPLVPPARNPHNPPPAPTVTLFPAAEIEAEGGIPQPTATLAVVPTVKLCAESDFNRSQGQCAYTMTELPRQSPIYVSWDPPTARLQRVETKRKGAAALREALPDKGEGYARLDARDFGGRLQPGATYVVRLHFFGVAAPAEVSFTVKR